MGFTAAQELPETSPPRQVTVRAKLGRTPNRSSKHRLSSRTPSPNSKEGVAEGEGAAEVSSSPRNRLRARLLRSRSLEPLPRCTIRLKPQRLLAGW